MKTSNIKSNFYSGLVVVLISVFFIAITPKEVPLYEASDALSSRFIPYVVLSLICILGLWLIANSLRLKLKEKKSLNIETTKKRKKAGRTYVDLFIFVGISIFILAFADIIGFTFAAILSLVTLLLHFGVKPWYKALSVGVIIPLVIEISYRFLEIYLPLGFWEDIIYVIFI